MDNLRSLVDVAKLNLLDERRYIDAYGTALDAARVLARETTMALGECLFGRETEVHLFVERLNALFGCELRHLDARDSCALLRG